MKKGRNFYRTEATCIYKTIAIYLYYLLNYSQWVIFLRENLFIQSLYKNFAFILFILYFNILIWDWILFRMHSPCTNYIHITRPTIAASPLTSIVDISSHIFPIKFLQTKSLLFSATSTAFFCTHKHTRTHISKAHTHTFVEQRGSHAYSRAVFILCRLPVGQVSRPRPDWVFVLPRIGFFLSEGVNVLWLGHAWVCSVRPGRVVCDGKALQLQANALVCCVVTFIFSANFWETLRMIQLLLARKKQIEFR